MKYTKKLYSFGKHFRQNRDFISRITDKQTLEFWNSHLDLLTKMFITLDDNEREYAYKLFTNYKNGKQTIS